jgi:cytochrome c biogenesis protein CcdA
MDEWIRQTLAAETIGLAVLPAAALLGALGALSASCSLPVIAAVAGYSGSHGARRKRSEILLVGLCFMVGTMVSLAALGAVTGYIGGKAGLALGRYWRLAAGLVMVFFGLVSLNLVPFRLPKFVPSFEAHGRGAASAMVYGLAVGGLTTACSFGCNPLIPVALGAALLQGATALGAAMLTAFALGYSLPLTAGLVGLGFGFGQLDLVGQRLPTLVRVGAGGLLIGLGFFLLATQ